MLAALITAALLAPAASGAAPRAQDDALRTALQEHLERFVADGRVPGVSAGVALVDGRALALSAGLADRASQRPLAPDDRLLAGSVGKTFVAAVALQLVQEGALGLDDLVGEHLGRRPWFERLPGAPTLTLRHLLAHRSGLPRYVFERDFVRALTSDPDRVWDPEELVGFVLDDPPRFAPDEGFAYSDTNYLVVGMVLEHVGGASLYDQIRRRLLDPLELRGVVPSDRRVVPGLVQGHAGERDPLGLPDEVLDAEGRFAINPQFEGAGGGFATTGGDLARWARALYAGEVLDAERRAAMLDAREAPELGPATAYGLGAIVWRTEHGPACGHSGFFPGYLTEVRFWPDHGVAVAAQVNTSDFRAVPYPLGRLCEELLADALAERVREEDAARERR